jgi:hypothetical protein
MGKVPAPGVAAFSDDLECPNCHARLGSPGILGGALPLLYAVLAFGIVSALGVILSGDLRPAPEPPPVEAAPAAGHGHAAHGDGHH